MPLTLTWRGPANVPIEGAPLRPDRLDRPLAEILRTLIRVGNARAELGDLAHAEGSGADGHLIVAGDLRAVAGLGSAMELGRLEVRGDAGHRVGAGMLGGTIEVAGDAGSGVGAGMLGGTIRVRGDVEDDLGAAEPGARVGMTGGLILVGGDAGDGVGTALRRGIIAVGGSAGAGTGRALIAGSIVVGRGVGGGLGSGMKRGTIALLGPVPEFDPGPTFEPSGTLRPVAATLLLRELARQGWTVPASAWQAPIRRYNGDRATGGQGEVWCFADSP